MLGGRVHSAQGGLNVVGAKGASAVYGGSGPRTDLGARHRSLPARGIPAVKRSDPSGRKGIIECQQGHIGGSMRTRALIFGNGNACRAPFPPCVMCLEVWRKQGTSMKSWLGS